MDSFVIASNFKIVPAHSPRPIWIKKSHSDHSSLKVNITIAGPYSYLQNFKYLCLLKSWWLLLWIKKFIGQLHNDGNYNLKRVRFRQFQTHHWGIQTFWQYLENFWNLANHWEKNGFNLPPPCLSPAQHDLAGQDYTVHGWKRFGCRDKLTFS